MMASLGAGVPLPPGSKRESNERETTFWTTVSSQPTSYGRTKHEASHTSGAQCDDPEDQHSSATESSVTASPPYAKIESVSAASDMSATTNTRKSSMASENFSTDEGETRIVELKDASRTTMKQQLKHCFDGGQIIEKIVSKTSSDDLVTVWIYFDDLRDAKFAKDNLPQYLGGCTSRFVAVDNFVQALVSQIGAKSDIHDVNSLAQYELVADWIGDSGKADVKMLIESCVELARSFGKLRHSAVLSADESVQAKVRVEFNKLSDSKTFVDSTGLGHTHKIDKNINVAVNQHHVILPAPSALIPHEFPDTTPPKPSPSPGGATSQTKSLPNTISTMATTDDNTFVHQGVDVYERAYSQALAMMPAHDPFLAPEGPLFTRPGHYQSPASFEGPPHQSNNCSRSSFRSGRGGRRGFGGWYDRDHEDRRGQVVSIADIENGMDVRTTIMVRNIPNRFDFKDVYRYIAPTSKGHFDFIYVRMDFGNSCNVGYGFINFVRPELIIPFIKAYVGKPWPEVPSDKLLEVSYATSQGVDSLIQKFRNSSVMSEYSGYRPKLFYHIDSTDIPEGKNVGDEYTFPKPDNHQKLTRSLANAQTIGLYPPRGARGGRGDGRRGRSQWDRGTPGALRDEAMALERSNAFPDHGYHDNNAYHFTPARGRANGPMFGPIAPPMQTLTENLQHMSFETPRYTPNPMNAYRDPAHTYHGTPRHNGYFHRGDGVVVPQNAANHHY